MPSLILEDTIYTLEQLKEQTAPQIALAGRSNVGKSSLINALANRKSLARISATPGKTRSINFYRVDPDNYYLVDLPGYGYARCSKEERQKWAVLIQRYLIETPAVCALAVLLDCRIPPQALDVDLTSFAKQSGIALLPILTKADKCNQRERRDRQRQWEDLLGGVSPIISSSKTKLGCEALWNAMRNLAVPDTGLIAPDTELIMSSTQK